MEMFVTDDVNSVMAYSRALLRPTYFRGGMCYFKHYFRRKCAYNIFYSIWFVLLRQHS